MYMFKRSQILLPLLASLLIVTPLLSSSLRSTYLYFIINLLIIALVFESGLLSSLLSNPNPNPISDDRKQHVSPPPPSNGPCHDISASKDDNVSPCHDVSASKDNNVIPQEKMPNKVVEKCNSEKIAGGGSGLKAAIASVKIKCPLTPSMFFIGGGETQSPETAREESGGQEKRPNKVVEKCNPEKITGGGSGLKAVIASVKIKCPLTPSMFFIGGGETESPEAAREESGGEEQEEEEEEELAGVSSQELFTSSENFIGNFYKQLKMQRQESWKRIHGFYQKAF